MNVQYIRAEVQRYVEYDKSNRVFERFLAYLQFPFANRTAADTLQNGRILTGQRLNRGKS